MTLLKADLSEMELLDLEKQFMAPSASSTSYRASRGRARAGGNIRYVELLHWGAPGRRAREGGEEVSAYLF